MASSWQPIETAPKDGTEILAWQKGEGAFVVFWYSRLFNWKWTTHDLGGDENLYPSHWMPLPAPPTTEGEN